MIALLVTIIVGVLFLVITWTPIGIISSQIMVRVSDGNPEDERSLWWTGWFGAILILVAIIIAALILPFVIPYCVFRQISKNLP